MFWLILGIILNLLCLSYFKYTDFLLSSLNQILNTSFHQPGIILPLAISFFTFQQIAFLVDSQQGKTQEYSFSHYCLFVTFFPQLLAGPIVHHSEMMPQFKTAKATTHSIAMGVTIICLGLFKKTILSETFQSYSDQVFSLSNTALTLPTIDAWCGMLSYSLHIYFDFSAYCDIACGIALLFGIRLPQNFASPYKSSNIILFWKRWHMTLSRFLRDYIYIPLGGSRHGSFKRYRNLFLTMLLGGLWHGAGWTFILWGAIHGIYLIINHGWKKIIGKNTLPESRIYTSICILFTYLFISIAWVAFRSDSLQSAQVIWSSLYSLQGLFEDTTIRQPIISDLFRQLHWNISKETVLISVIVLFHIWIWGLPNLQQIMRAQSRDGTHNTNDMVIKEYPMIDSKISWSRSISWLLLSAFCLSASILSLQNTGEFIYFQF